MNEKRGNILLIVILVILMIVAIAIVLINPNKVDNTAEINKIEENENSESSITENQNTIKQINEQEEKIVSMQENDRFCKIGDKIVLYDVYSNNLYYYDLSSGESKKLLSKDNTISRIYFDGEYVYYLPQHYSGKGIYKIDLEGNSKKIYEDESTQLLVTENEIYFVKQNGWDEINANPQGTICVMDKEGNNVKEIAQSVKNYFYMNNDRKMYAINKDGTNQEELTQGRRFVLSVSDKYLTYIDYGSQEAKHILNLETKEDSLIGYFGEVRKYQGRTFINVRTRLEDGALTDEYTLFEVKDDSNIVEIGKVADFVTDLKYITNNKAYVFNKQEDKTYIINTDTKEKQETVDYNNCRFYLGGYGYKINTENPDEIKIEKLEL